MNGASFGWGWLYEGGANQRRNIHHGGALASVAVLATVQIRAQEADVSPAGEIVPEQYLPIVNATRADGESSWQSTRRTRSRSLSRRCRLSIRKRGQFQHNELAIRRTPHVRITEFAVSRDRGLTWTVTEDPIRKFYRYRCLDPFAAFTPDDTLILGCVAHFPEAHGTGASLWPITNKKH